MSAEAFLLGHKIQSGDSLNKGEKKCHIILIIIILF